MQEEREKIRRPDGWRGSSSLYINGPVDNLTRSFKPHYLGRKDSEMLWICGEVEYVGRYCCQCLAGESAWKLAADN